MNDLQDRIERFKNMAMADPSNDMAHYSLGSAYFDARMFEEAAQSFEACTKLNPDMTRAMELGGSAMMQLGRTDEAKDLLLKGYEQAASRGERRVQDGIAEILKAAGIATPSIETDGANSQIGTPLEEVPLPGAIGKWIFDNIDSDRWSLWITQGTKVINELRLDFSRAEDQNVFEEYMAEYLGIPKDIVEQDKSETSECK